MIVTFFHSAKLALPEVITIDFEAISFHIRKQFSERSPIFHVQSQISAHLFFFGRHRSELVAECFPQEIENFGIKTRILDPVRYVLLRTMHQLYVWHHEYFAPFPIS